MDSLALPRGFIPASDVLEERVKPGKLVSVIGVVKDCRLPMATVKEDWKCTVTLCDLSSQNGGDIVLNIFRPQDEMPVVGAGDVVLALMVKVQMFREDPLSLITNRQTTRIMVYESAKIPPHPASARPAWQEPKKNTSKDLLEMVSEAEAYIPWMYQVMDRSMIPNHDTFNHAAAQSLNFKDKFSLLESVRQDKFYNVIVEVVRPPYDLADKTTIWVTDYTENRGFYHKTPDSTSDSNLLSSAHAGDSLGYTSRFQPLVAAADSGTGPYGKRCMQVTCYEPHASRVRNIVRSGSWVMLRNLQVKYGSNGSNLEGFLREDRGSLQGRIQVELLNPLDELENIDHRLQSAIGRKRKYEKSLKAHTKELSAQQGKRKRQAPQAEPKPPNTRQKRNKKRMMERESMEESASSSGGVPTLKGEVKCENMSQTPTLVHRILEGQFYRTASMDQNHEIPLPFNCVKYRSNVRVIDFFPRQLEDFASSRKVTEFNCHDDTCSGSSGVSDDGTASGKVIWEWRFSLRLQDAIRPAQQAAPADIWVIVDNASAQLLLNLDACNLRADTDTLGKLRERLFLLWGNLEQLNTDAWRKQEEMNLRKTSQQSPSHSSDAEGAASPPQDVSPQQDNPGLVNEPFSCCIRQYGIKVKESIPLKSDAGHGKRWERVFGLFGTKISMP